MPQAVVVPIVTSVSASAGAWLASGTVLANLTLAGIQAAAFMGLSALTAPRAQAANPASLIDLKRNADQPREMIIGRRSVGGQLADVYLNSNGKNIYYLILLADHRCNGVTRVTADGREVYSSRLAHGVKTNLPEFRSGGDRLWLTFWDGRPDQNIQFTAKNDGLITLGGASQACILMEAQWDSDNLRRPPNLTFEVEGAPLYDRRKDDTAGGAGPHRYDDPSTWEYSANPAVARDHFVLGYQLPGESEPRFGKGLAPNQVPYADFAAAANLCDEEVEVANPVRYANYNAPDPDFVPSGYWGDAASGIYFDIGQYQDTQTPTTILQKRYEFNGLISSAETFADVVKRFDVQMGAISADAGGVLSINTFKVQPSVLTLTDADVMAPGAETWTPKRDIYEIVTSVEGRYVDPNEDYQTAEYPRVEDPLWAFGEPDDVRRIASLELQDEVHPERAQRLARIFGAREARQGVLSGVYHPKALKLLPGEWFTRQGERFPGGKVFEVEQLLLAPTTPRSAGDRPSVGVQIVAREVDPTDVAWDNNTASPIELTAPNPSVNDGRLEAPIPTVTVTEISGGGLTLPAISVQWSQVEDPRVAQVRVRVWKRDAEGVVVGDPIYATADSDQLGIVVSEGLEPVGQYQVALRSEAGTQRSAWSPETIINIGSTYTVPRALEAESVAPDSELQLQLAKKASQEALELGMAVLDRLRTGGFNQIQDPTFEDLSIWADAAIEGAAAQASFQEANIEGVSVLTHSLSGAPAAGERFNIGQVWDGRLASGVSEILLLVSDQETAPPDVSTLTGHVLVSDGARIEASVGFDAQGVADVGLYARVFDVYGQELALVPVIEAVTPNAGAWEAGVAYVQRIGGFVELNADNTPNIERVAAIGLVARATADGAADPQLRIGQPLLRLATPGQTTLSPYDDRIATLDASVTQVATELSTEVAARALAIQEVSAATDDVDAKIIDLQQAVAGDGEAHGVIIAEINAAGQVVGWRAVAGQVEGQYISQLLFTAALARFDGNVIVDNTLTAAKIVDGSLTDAQLSEPSDVALAIGSTEIASVQVDVEASDRVILDGLAGIVASLFPNNTTETNLFASGWLDRNGVRIKNFNGPSHFESNTSFAAQLDDPIVFKYSEKPGAGTHEYSIGVNLGESGDSTGFLGTPEARDIFLMANVQRRSG